jgi:Ca-activated chloride channel family protein
MKATMSTPYFEIDFWALFILFLIGAVIYLARKWSFQFSKPHFRFSNLNVFLNTSPSWRTHLAPLSKWLGFLSLALFSLAFIDPRFYLPKDGNYSQAPSKGIAIYLVLDQSGSMKNNVVTMLPSGTYESIKKTELLKKLSTEFIKGNPQAGLQGRPNDLIGLVYFARTAHVIAPLTLNHSSILKDLDKFNTVQNKNEDGTAIGYAIFKTTNLIAATQHFAEDLKNNESPAYDIKNAIIILVTDGFHDPNTLDDNNPLRSIGVLGAAEYAKEKKVKVYVINVEPAMASEQYAPNRRQMQQATEITGGHFYMLDNSTSLLQAYADIDKLEKSILPTQTSNITSKDEAPHLYRRISLYPTLIALGMVTLLLSVLVKTILIRQIP